MNGSPNEYNIFRWYRPGWGRYSQSDPNGLAPDNNLYRYARGNPVLLTDRRGLQAAQPCPSGTAACVLCRNGEPDVFFNQTNLPQPFQQCVEWHEQDHVNFWRREVCGACQGVPDGDPPRLPLPRSGMSPQEQSDFASDFRARLECSGYRTEYQCLGFNRNSATNPSAVDDRRIQLRTEAKNRFRCPVDSW